MNADALETVQAEDSLEVQLAIAESLKVKDDGSLVFRTPKRKAEAITSRDSPENTNSEEETPEQRRQTMRNA